jgi:hypothetical protein
MNSLNAGTIIQQKSFFGIYLQGWGGCHMKASGSASTYTLLVAHSTDISGSTIPASAIVGSNSPCFVQRTLSPTSALSLSRSMAQEAE